MAMLSIIVLLTFEKNILENVAQREDTLEAILIVYNDNSMHSRLADGIEDRVQTII